MQVGGISSSPGATLSSQAKGISVVQVYFKLRIKFSPVSNLQLPRVPTSLSDVQM